MIRNIKTKQYLDADGGLPFILYVTSFAFLSYSCMYAFRKPFTVGMFSEVSLFDIDIKIWFIAAQVLGYTLSKFIGIKVVSEMNANKRANTIVILVLIAEISLLFFAISPNPYKIIFMFINGLPLGIVWGLVFAYLEGRKYTELLGAGLCTSFIFSSGIVKSVGKWLLVDFNVSEYWMPFFTGLIFLIPLLISVYLLNKTPPPSLKDEALRTHRKPMTKVDRLGFLKEFAVIIVVLIVVYALLTIFRELRDNFAAEIWESIGLGNNAAVFTLSEIPVGLSVLACMAVLSLVKNNTLALNLILLIIIIGFIIIGLATFLFQTNLIQGKIWMILIGIGLYLGYVPFNALLFERMIASFKYVGNIGFIMYLADSFGYLSSIAVFITKNFLSAQISWLQFFIQSAYFMSLIGIVLTTLTIWLFYQKRTANYKNLSTTFQ
jgi:MFS family permease